MIHSLRAFSHRNFRLFFFGQSLGIIGYWVQQIAMAWLVYRLTGSAWLLGVTAFAGQIAVLVLAPFGGLWADRVDRRKLLVVTQSGRGDPRVHACHARLARCGRGLARHRDGIAARAWSSRSTRPSASPFCPRWCPTRQDLPSAIAFNSGMYNAARMIGPTIAGVLLAVSSEAFCFLVNGMTKLAALIPLVMMAIDARRTRQPHTLDLEGIQGWRGLRLEHGAGAAAAARGRAGELHGDALPGADADLRGGGVCGRRGNAGLSDRRSRTGRRRRHPLACRAQGIARAAHLDRRRRASAPAPRSPYLPIRRTSRSRWP